MRTATTRKSPRCLLQALTVVLAWVSVLHAAPKQAGGTCHALLIGGMPGTGIHARHYRDWLTRFHRYLTGPAKVPAANVVVLSGEKGFSDPVVNGLATAESIEKALADMAGRVEEADQFILFMVGLGVSTEPVPAFVVPGPDVNARQLADGLARIRARNQVVLNFSASSGESAPILSAERRVVVSANMPNENTPPVYAEFFLRGLESGRADGRDAPAAGKKDGTITLLEAYHWAAFNTAQWIARQRKAGEDLWRVDGAESVEVFRKLYVSAAGESGSRRLDPASDASSPDRVVRLKLEGAEDEIAKSRRRVVTEHASLEDCGAEEPVSALGDETKDYVPLAGKGEAEPGYLAGRVVLGRAELMPAQSELSNAAGKPAR
ncbi:MAG: hypothetical protein WBF17_24870 [Phycisphaerae bacterium]